MAKSSVLIAGLNGLGAESAKNVILAGVKSVSLWDSKATQWDDLASQFYLTEADIGKPRAAASVAKLSELNPYVDVSVFSAAELSPDSLATANFTVVVLIDQPLSVQETVAAFCHAQGIACVIGDVRGVFGSIFCDFGEKFVVHDTTGEPNASSMLAGITCDNPALVTTLEETRHGLESGDRVILSEITGMEALNGKQFTVTVKGPYSFEIDADTRSMTPYVRGGYANQVKTPVTLSFDSFSKSYAEPGMFICDFTKMDCAASLHLAFRALLHYQQENDGNLPTPGSDEDAAAVFAIAQRLNGVAGGFGMDPKELDANRNTINQLARCARGNISPVAALVGGILGQEILKACSGKFMPVKQWFYFDAAETLPTPPLPQSQVQPRNCRYDGQIMIYGHHMQEKLSSLNMFLVGAGAIGCEMVKNWALMGVATANTGCAIHITDMDRIEKSNLSRQFLFRNGDIGHPKSTTAARAINTMNPHVHAIAYEQKVCPDTEDMFDDTFFEGISMVCTALDNVEARLYIDQRCLFYHRPLLESGTLGTKGHTQIVVPNKTEHYGATRDPPEKTIPICTLKSFPNQIEHTLQWARELYEEIFKQTPDDANSYLTSADFVSNLQSQQNMKLDTLSRIKQALVDDMPYNFEDCIAWARTRFEDLFCNKIKQLLHNFPADKVQPGGALFWSGAKRAPTPLTFEVTDPLHMEFLQAWALMRAEPYGIAIPPMAHAGDVDYYSSVVASVQVPTFRPADNVTIAVTDEEAKAEATNNNSSNSLSGDIDSQCSLILSQLPPRSSTGSFTLKSIDFDKDIDSHMRVVAACSNLRARNYRIPEADLHVSRGIAGKITPAIATTTALVTGAICLEIYKLVQDKDARIWGGSSSVVGGEESKTTEAGESMKYMNSFTNLALPLFTNMEPNPPKTTTSIIKGREWKWTQWDRIDIRDPSMTLAGLIDYVEGEYGLELTMLSSGVSILYSSYMNKKKMDERKGMKLKVRYPHSTHYTSH